MTNTGDRAGREVVQVYVHHRAPGVLRPPKELKAFAKVHLEPGETRTVELRLDRQAFAYWNEQRHEWSVEAGWCDILVGASSADIRAEAPLEIVAEPVPGGAHADVTPSGLARRPGRPAEGRSTLLRSLASTLERGLRRRLAG